MTHNLSSDRKVVCIHVYNKNYQNPPRYIIMLAHILYIGPILSLTLIFSFVALDTDLFYYLIESMLLEVIYVFKHHDL